MTQPGASLTPGGPAASADGPLSSADRLTRAFNDMRDELVSTLLYLLGNRDDAQDAAQEAFVKCWRTRDSLPDVQNLRAWIFRVGLNAAKDMQRSAWNRKAKPLLGDEIMIVGRDARPGDLLEEQEDLARLRDAILGPAPGREGSVPACGRTAASPTRRSPKSGSAPVGTVKTQMRSALQKLRKVLA